MPADCGVRKLWRECAEEYSRVYARAPPGPAGGRSSLPLLLVDARLKQRALADRRGDRRERRHPRHLPALGAAPGRPRVETHLQPAARPPRRRPPATVRRCADRLDLGARPGRALRRQALAGQGHGRPARAAAERVVRRPRRHVPLRGRRPARRRGARSGGWGRSQLATSSPSTARRRGGRALGDPRRAQPRPHRGDDGGPRGGGTPRRRHAGAGRSMGARACWSSATIPRDLARAIETVLTDDGSAPRSAQAPAATSRRTWTPASSSTASWRSTRRHPRAEGGRRVRVGLLPALGGSSATLARLGPDARLWTATWRRTRARSTSVTYFSYVPRGAGQYTSDPALLAAVVVRAPARRPPRIRGRDRAHAVTARRRSAARPCCASSR